MRFTKEVSWGPEDFVAMGAMLLAACGAYELVAQAPGNGWSRAGAGVAIVTAFLLVWVNLAVGFLGDEGNEANLLFAGVLAVALVGSALARLRPAGMARTMAATAGAKLLVGVGALGLGLGGLYEIVMGTGLFTGLWALSAVLFRAGVHPSTR